jgi:hypothetical protein
MGYRKRTSFLAGLTVAQISEFSLIFAGLGLQVGHLNEEVVGLITLVGLITIGLSTYLILYSHQIYKFIAPALSIFEMKHPYSEEDIERPKGVTYDIIIFGLGRFGNTIASKLESQGDIRYFGIDFDPQQVALWQSEGRDVAYGDIEDPDIIEHLPLLSVKCIISTIPNVDYSIQLVKALRNSGYQGKIFISAMNDKESEILDKCSVDGVLIPQKMAAENFYNSILSTLLSDKKQDQH